MLSHPRSKYQVPFHKFRGANAVPLQIEAENGTGLRQPDGLLYLCA